MKTGPITDKDRLDFIDNLERHNGPIIFRQSTTGRGFRIHRTHRDEVLSIAFPTIREAIDDAIRRGEVRKPEII